MKEEIGQTWIRREDDKPFKIMEQKITDSPTVPHWWILIEQRSPMNCTGPWESLEEAEATLWEGFRLLN